MREAVFRSVRIYLISAAVICTAVALVATIFLTQDSLQWIAFLTGILIASVLAEAARASRSEWVLMRRTAQLASIKEKLDLEMSLRKSAEGKFAAAQGRLQLVDDNLTNMVVLVDAEGYCRYHNNAFRKWLDQKAEKIDGRTLRELLGSKAYAGIATAVRQSLDGQSLRYEHLQEMPGGAVYRLLVEHIPQLDATGKVTGFYFLAEDITKHEDLSNTEKYAFVTETGKSEAVGRKMNADPVHLGGRKDEGKLFIAAILEGEFLLFCQLITPLPLHSGKTAHYEILVRLAGEEGGLIPPGAFFPMAEKNGLMPYLDRWVVQKVLEWAASQQSLGRDKDSIFFLNIAPATIGDPEFPDFLQSALAESGMPGASLCFEVNESDLAARNGSVVEFIGQVRRSGCGVALSGFGSSAVLFDQIRGFQVEFLKVDGSTILGMLGDPETHAKVVAINRTAKKIGVKTIAEMVESDEVVENLSKIGVDFAQGFGISRPRRLME